MSPQAVAAARIRRGWRVRPKRPLRPDETMDRVCPTAAAPAPIIPTITRCTPCGRGIPCLGSPRDARLSARDLAWLNGQSLDQPLQIGQQIKLPHQAYLDAGRAAKNKFLALHHYLETHDGKLPPDVANPPALVGQILDTNWQRKSKNGYDFHIDVIARNRRTYSQLSLAVSLKRSRRNQAQAGKPNRRGGDDGGHFIAARFNGPSDRFNHFAQNANFNRGSYRVMDSWARELRAGHKVFVDIEPLYEGTSQRPYQLNIIWEVDSKKFIKKFPNEAKGAEDGKR